MGIAGFGFGCASGASRPNAGVAQVTPVPSPVGQTTLDVKNPLDAHLSAPSVPNAGSLLVDLALPPGLLISDIQGRFAGVEFPFYPAPRLGKAGAEAVFGVPYDTAVGPATVEIAWSARAGFEAGSVSLPFQVISGDYPNKKESLQVAPSRVNPPQSEMARIEREQKQVGKVYRELISEKFWDGPLELPVNLGTTSRFGTRRFYNGEPRSPHMGEDLKAALGTPIHAPAGGIVALAKNLYFTGNTIILDHGYGVLTLYGHLSRIQVKHGARVKKGQLLGLAGMTGRVTGPHLHWGAIVHTVKVDPMQLKDILR